MSPWEWVTGAIGLALVLAAAGLLVHEARMPPSPPDIVLRVDSTTRVSQGYLVHFTAWNRGRSTATEVEAEAVLVVAPADTARSATTLDYVPGRSRRRGGFYFSHDPRLARLEVRARGFAAP